MAQPDINSLFQQWQSANPYDPEGGIQAYMAHGGNSLMQFLAPKGILYLGNGVDPSGASQTAGMTPEQAAHYLYGAGSYVQGPGLDGKPAYYFAKADGQPAALTTDEQGNVSYTGGSFSGNPVTSVNRGGSFMDTLQGALSSPWGLALGAGLGVASPAIFGGGALGGAASGAADVLPDAVGAAGISEGSAGMGAAGGGLGALGAGAGAAPSVSDLLSSVTTPVNLPTGSAGANILPDATQMIGGGTGVLSGGTAAGSGAAIGDIGTAGGLGSLPSIPSIPSTGGGGTNPIIPGETGNLTTDAAGNVIPAGTQVGGTTGSTATVPVDTSGGLSAANATTAGSALSRLLSGNATAQDYASLLGTLGTTATGIIGADLSRSANNAAADKMLALGAPAREAYNATLAPGFNPSTGIPGYQSAVDSVMNAYLRKASTGGNPFSNPGVSMEANNYVTGNTALPAIQNYRNSLTAQGSIGVPNANAPNLAAAGAVNTGVNAVSGGLGALSTPTTDLASILRQLGIGGGGASNLLSSSPASL